MCFATKHVYKDVCLSPNNDTLVRLMSHKNIGKCHANSFCLEPGNNFISFSFHFFSYHQEMVRFLAIPIACFHLCSLHIQAVSQTNLIIRIITAQYLFTDIIIIGEKNAHKRCIEKQRYWWSDAHGCLDA